MRDLLRLQEALAAVLDRVSVLPAESVPVPHAVGRVLGENASATVDLPPFPSSAMDGFAVRAADTPGDLAVAFRISTGRASDVPLPPGAAAAISTGGVVPDGADAVVPVEVATESDGRVQIDETTEPGRHIRPRGGDVRAGDLVLAAGTVLRPRHLGSLSAAGIAGVTCGLRPRVAVLTTGSELRAPGEALSAGQIYESNRPMLAAVLARTGAEVDVLPAVEDEESAHRSALERGLEADVLVTSGGVSMGTQDLVRRVERELGVEEVFWGVAVKPGKPLSFGVRGRTFVFGLPGNPVSALVGALVFVSPALLALQGAHDPGPAFQPGVSGSAIRPNPDRDEFLRARRRLEEAVVLDPVTGQESHMIVRAAAADALVHVPRGAGELPAGSPVRYLSLD